MCSSSGSKFQEVTSQYLKSDHQYSKSLSASLKSDHHRRSQSVQAASHFMIPHFSDNLSSRGVGTRSEPEEEVVTMRWKRGELVSILFILKYIHVESNVRVIVSVKVVRC